MTSRTGYTAEQDLARDLLNLALNGGASVYWAHVHGVSLGGPPEQIRAEGIHLSDRSVWNVDLDDLTRAVTKLIEHPDDYVEPGNVSDRYELPYVSASLAAARTNGVRRVSQLTQPAPNYSPMLTRELIADYVMQVAVTGEVTR